MKSIFPVTLLVCFLLGVPSLGQVQTDASPGAKTKPAKTSSTDDGLRLTWVETIDSPSVFASSFAPPFRCDAEGNVYLYNNLKAAIVQKVNRKGEPVGSFQARPNTDKTIDIASKFAVAANGDFYQLTFPHELSRYVFTYKSDGTFKSAIKLEPGFPWMPSAIDVFPSGQMLISGLEYDKDRTAAMWPVTGIFSADGRLLKEVKLEDDETLHDMAAAGDARVSMPGLPPQSNLAVSASQIEMAEDGNAYLMRWTNPAIIYAISPGGEVIRRIKIDPGDSDYRTMHIFKNRIAVLFIQPDHEKTLMIVDLEGHEIARYREVESKEQKGGPLTGAFYCYTENPTRFTFLRSSDDHKLQFWIAEPR
jgi:hypothetical protein